ncbi:MAG: class II aldolase [Clostridiales bacterium]|jgi:rhamnose utilization protein RhaD (predicted bifunctional aldolase and dehydrogenase)|nr:class II aldolase [Clostridiales bacterium]
MDTLETLIEFSRKYGADPELVNAGGGNTSAKQDGIMYIKCSGTALKDASEASFAKMDLEKLYHIFERRYPEGDREREAAVLADMMACRVPGEEHKRPSVETLLHALFRQKYVLHLHPALVNGLTCSRGGEAEAGRLLGDEVAWVPACRPGYTLALLMHEKMKAAGSPLGVVLLENHGVFFAADTPGELDRMLSDMTEKLAGCIREFPQTGDGGAEPGYGEKLAKLSGCEYFCYNGSTTARAFAASLEAAKDLLTPFNPDQVVYCGPGAEYVDDVDRVRAIRKKTVLVRGAGLYTFGRTEKEARNALLLAEDAMKIAVYSRSFGGPRHLPEELVEFLVHWEAESYRKAL